MASSSNRPPSASIFIGNVGFGATEEELSALFKQVGPLKSFRLVTDRETGKAKGYAFAEYFDIATAQSAQRNLNGTEVSGRAIRVDFADHEKYSSDSRGGQPKVIGKEATAAASQTLAAVLGGGGGAGQQQISEALSKMTRPQIYEIMSQMKALIQQNPAQMGHILIGEVTLQARQILVQNPQLTKALFQAQIMLGMVKPPPLVATGPGGQGTPAPQEQPPVQLPAPIQTFPGQHGAPQPQYPPAAGQLNPPPAQYNPPPGQMQFAPQPQPQQQQGQPQGQQPMYGGPLNPNPIPMQPQVQVSYPMQQPQLQASFPQQQGLPRPQTLPAPHSVAAGPHPRPYAGQPAHQASAPGLECRAGLPTPLPVPQPVVGPARTLPPPPQAGVQDPRQMSQPLQDPRQMSQQSQDRRQMSMQPQPAPYGPRQQDPRQALQDPRQALQDPRQAQQDPRLGPVQHPGFIKQEQHAAPQDPRLQQQAARQQAPLDPRQQPQQQQQLPNPPPAALPQAVGAPAAQGLGHNEQQALLRQVMNLTQQQIDMLPEAQRQQVIELQRQLRSQVGMP